MYSKLDNVLLIGAVAMLASACEATSPAPSGPAASQEPAQASGRDRPQGGTGEAGEEGMSANSADISLALYPPPSNADAARWEGRLGLKGRCLVINGGDSATFAVPVFPEGKAEWDSAARVLTFVGKRYAIGDTIVVGGSFSKLGRPGMPAIRGLSPDCPGDSVWLVG